MVIKNIFIIKETRSGEMTQDSVIVDLAGEDGNVEESQYDKTLITDTGITILNVSAYPKKDPRRASEYC